MGLCIQVLKIWRWVWAPSERCVAYHLSVSIRRLKQSSKLDNTWRNTVWCNTTKCLVHLTWLFKTKTGKCAVIYDDFLFVWPWSKKHTVNTDSVWFPLKEMDIPIVNHLRARKKASLKSGCRLTCFSVWDLQNYDQDPTMEGCLDIPTRGDRVDSLWLGTCQILSLEREVWWRLVVL